MNFFFPICSNLFDCELTVPRFKNYKVSNNNFILFSAEIKDYKWKINRAISDFNENFYFLKNENLLDDKIFFLAESKIGENFFLNELKNFNNYTDTEPDYRANLNIKIKNGGFSSYQSDYSYDMTVKTGSIISPVSVLLNEKAENNFIFFKNIFKYPIKQKFYVYFIDMLNKSVLHKEILLTNTTNQINVCPSLIKANVYLYSENFIGIPIFVSIKNKHISMEHTHPPHLYIWGDDKFKRVQDLKKSVNEFIKKNI